MLPYSNPSIHTLGKVPIKGGNGKAGRFRWMIFPWKPPITVGSSHVWLPKSKSVHIPFISHQYSMICVPCVCVYNIIYIYVYTYIHICIPIGDTIDQDLFSFLDHLFDQELHPLYGSANLRMVRPWQSTGFHTDSVLWPSEMGIECDTIGIEWHMSYGQYSWLITINRG